jgi:hypothetical protein
MTSRSIVQAPSLGGGNFRFSAVPLHQLGAAEYTLVALGGDRSSSTQGFAQQIEAAFRSVAESCRRSPRADNLMLRAVRFNHQLDEIHGFKLLADVNPQADYAQQFGALGGTALYDATENLVRSVAAYGKQLADEEYAVNALVVVITDGCDEHSRSGVNAVREAFAEAMKRECLESLVSILIGVNVDNPQVSVRLHEFKQRAGFTQYVEAKDASPQTLARVANFISRSVSAQSSALGSGGPSRALTF